MPDRNPLPAGKQPIKKFPKVMLVMIPLQLAQAFSQNVVLCIKAIFITSFLGYTEDSAVMISHIFISFEPIAHLSGAIMADSKFGKWKVIVAGLLLMRIPDVFFVLSVLPGLPHRTLFLTAVTLATFLNIHLPTLSAFFSEQFIMPDQEEQLKKYYNILYWGRNAVSVLGAFSGSRMASLSCFGQNDCYFAPFVLWVSTEIAVALIIISMGAFFVRKPPTSSIILHFLGCVGRAIWNKVKFGKEVKRDRWIDHADDIFTDRFRDDVYIMVKLSYFFSLTIIYWSLYDQMYSRFIYQGAKLDSRITDKIRVFPGDTTMLNPILVIVLLPFLEYIVYPAFSKINMLKTDLQKVGTSEYLVASAFVAAALLEWQIGLHEIHPPTAGHGHVTVFNTINKEIIVSGDTINNVKIGPLSSHIFQNLPVQGKSYKDTNVGSSDSTFKLISSLEVEEKKGTSFILSDKGFVRISGYEKYLKQQRKDPEIRCICDTESSNDLILKTKKGKEIAKLHCEGPKSTSSYSKMKSGSYYIYKGTDMLNKGKIHLDDHLQYTIIMSDNEKASAQLFESNPHKLLSYFWIIPQIFIMTLGEIMHAIPWRVFIYTQSPPPMRSVVFALDLLSRSLGDLLVAVIAATSFLDLVHEFFLYAILMYTVSILFTLLAMKYKPQKSHE